MNELTRWRRIFISSHISLTRTLVGDSLIWCGQLRLAISANSTLTHSIVGVHAQLNCPFRLIIASQKQFTTCSEEWKCILSKILWINTL